MHSRDLMGVGMMAVVMATASVAAVLHAQEAPPIESAEVAAQKACGEAAKVIYRPPPDLVQMAAKRLREEGKQYRGDPVVVVTVGEDGLVREVQMGQSSGYRLLDVALRNWVTGYMFAPQDCKPATRYLVRFPVAVAGGS